MKKQLQIFQKSNLFYPILLLFVACVFYLFYVNQTGLFSDDWYLIFDGHAQGPDFFHEVYKWDRPGRGYLFEAAYALFGDHVVYYKISSFIFRYLSALFFYWLLNQVWRRQKKSNFMMAIVILIYPGFLMQVLSIDYLAQLTSLMLAMLSIALTVKVLQATLVVKKIGFGIMAVIFGWIYLGLVEYHIGLEFLRLLFVYLLVVDKKEDPLKQKLTKVFTNWLPFVLIPLVFLIWRVFFFSNTRISTDLGYQMGIFNSSPIHTGLWWIINMVTSYLNAVLFAWAIPFYKTINSLRLKDILLVFGIAAGLIAFMLLLFHEWNAGGKNESEREDNNSNWIRLSMIGGGLAVLVALFPIILVNREINLEGYSRYALPALPGIAMLLTGFLYKLVSERARFLVIGIMLFIASATHIGNAINYANNWDEFQNFWWQVSWRAPQIQPGTTLTTLYPSTRPSDDYVIWGPANLIYYPKKQFTVPIKIQLPAIILEGVNFPNILAQVDDSEYIKHGNLTHWDYRSLLVLAQGLPSNCVRILDGTAPELSVNDEHRIMLVAPFSKMERIMVDEQPAIPPESIFGPEPKHTWCYYYEKAALAQQRLDWAEVIRLMDQAKQNGYGPLDRIEWLPLLQAYVATGQEEKLAPFVSIILDDNFVRSQSCPILERSAQETRPDDIEMQAYIGDTFCK